MTARPHWAFVVRTAGEWRVVGDDYLLPHHEDYASQGGLCGVAWGSQDRALLQRFAPEPRPASHEYWWGKPSDPRARKERALACYLIACMMEDTP